MSDNEGHCLSKRIDELEAALKEKEEGMIRRNVMTGGEDDGWWIRESHYLAEIAKRERGKG